MADTPPPTMPDLALQEASLKALGDTIAAQLKAVRAAMQQQMDTTGASRVNATLPDGTKVGTIYATEPKLTAVVTDEDTLKTWVREHLGAGEITSRVVTEIRPATRAALLAQITAIGAPMWPDADGEPHDVPGVEIRATRARGHSVRLADGAAEAISKAWRTGQLDHVVLPQLTTGDDTSQENQA